METTLMNSYVKNLPPVRKMLTKKLLAGLSANEVVKLYSESKKISLPIAKAYTTMAVQGLNAFRNNKKLTNPDRKVFKKISKKVKSRKNEVLENSLNLKEINKILEKSGLKLSFFLPQLKKQSNNNTSIKRKFTTTVTQPHNIFSKKKSTTIEGEINLIPYSVKSFAIVGDTKPIKDILKTLGGRFNPKLTCGAGWIFSNNKEAEVRTILNL